MPDTRAAMKQICSTCGGTQVDAEGEPCPTCKGTGMVDLDVELPAEDRNEPGEEMPAEAVRHRRPTDLLSRSRFRGTVPLKADVNRKSREVIAIAATFGDIDYNERRLMNGAFDKSINDQLAEGEIKWFVEHSVNRGVVLECEQRGTDLWTLSRVTNTRAGDEALEMCSDGSFTHYSYRANAIRYNFVPKNPAEETVDYDDQIMNVVEARLYHVGPVSEPANRGAKILEVAAAAEGLVDDLGDLINVMQHICDPKTELTRRQKFQARHFLCAAHDLLQYEPTIRALIEPAHGTRSNKTAPPLATESSAVVEAPTVHLAAALEACVMARKVGRLL